MSKFFTLLTTVGEAKLANATALGQTVKFEKMAIGDGNGELPVPDQKQTALVNEVRREPLNAVETDPDNPNWIVCEQVIPENVGGWTIREVGIYDVDGDLIAVGNFPETYKPILEEGSGRTQTVRIVLQVSSTATVEIKIDPSVVLATRKYVDEKDAAHQNEANPHPQYPLAANTVSGQNATRTTQINEGTAQGALMSGFWTVYTNNNLNYYPSSKLQYPIHMIKSAYSVVGNKGGLEILGGDSKTSPLFFRVSTGVGAGTLQQLYSDTNPPPVDKVTGAQYAPYSPTRVYKCGEVCTTEVDGIVQFWEWYSNVESLAGKDPSLTANRQDGWEDDTKPYYWMPHKKARAGTPLFPWLSETIPEGTLNVVGNSVPAAVFWRLAEAFPEFVNADTQMIDFPETRGEFFRVLDQGRGIDNGRTLGSTQAQSIEHHGIQLMGKGSNDAVSIGNIVHLGRRGTGADPVGIVGYAGSTPLPNQYYDNYSGTPYGSYSDGDDETRPSNLAFPVLVEV
ncbi:phage tail protein [Vibrio fluvialis]|nr:phage tail protein [Vibrio fluvialis]